LIGGAGNDYLAGDAYSDTLVGGGGDDELDAFGGDDMLTGGMGADMFNVRTDSGNDVITDFEAGQGVRDMVSFVDDPFDTMDFDTIMAHLSQDGADTLLTLSEADSIRFVGVNVDAFMADNFLWG